MPPTHRPQLLRGLAANGLLLLLLLATGPVSGAPIQFRTATSYITGEFQMATVSGDFDGDLDPDIAALRQSGVLQWWSNAGGALSGPFTVATPFAIRDDLVAGDLNGDGRADLVGCDDASPGGALAVFFASGAGFAPASLVPTDSAGVASATIADLDGDGDLDLVASNRRTRKVHRLFNDGAGSFSGLASTVIVGEVSRTWVAELNGDSNPDILVGHWPQLLFSAGVASPFRFGGFRSVSWTLAGTGGGSFAAPSGSTARAIVALGAFSGPGSTDAYVYDSLGIGIAPGNGDGTFAPPIHTPGVSLPCGEAWGSAIDLDGDGKDEVAIINGCGSAQYHVFRIDGSHHFAHRETYKTSPTRTPVVADMNGDGRLDAVLQNGLVALNRDGRLSGTRLLPRYEADYTFFYSDVLDLDAGDLNGDGVDDVLVSTRSNLGSMFISNGDGSFQRGQEWQVNSYTRQAEIIDLDGDGDRDILHRHDDSGDVDFYAWLNDGTGHVAGTTGVDLPVTGSSGLTVADFDADGDSDALTTNFAPAGILYLNDGTGTFVASPCSPAFGIYLPVGGDARPGRFSTSGNYVQVERMTGTCTLDPPIQVLVGAIVTARFADVNNDGCTDAVCLLAGNQVSTVLGQPGGSWSAPIVSPDSPIAPGYTPAFASIGDLDDDGRRDLVFTGTGTPNVVSAMRNLGGGVFGERGDSYTNQAFGTVIGDVDGDGAGDLLGVQPEPGGQSFTHAANILMGIAADQPTPALVSLVSATATPDAARLTWWISSDVATALTVERSTEGAAWTRLASVSAVGGLVTYEDREVAAGARYSWRVLWSENGIQHMSDAVNLAIPARGPLAIAAVRPNPADGDRLRVSLALDRTAPLELKILDLAGRVVASRRVSPATTGEWIVEMDGLSSLRAGLYFVRVEQAGVSATRTMVRLK